jgi:alpha-glucan,water dikinase
MAFLDTGSMETFWATAWERGGLTAEDLATMDHPLTATPLHLPHLKGAFEHYLTILKCTHGGASLDAAVSAARGCVGGDLAWALGDLLDHRHEWWVPGKLVELRGALRPLWTAPGASRDLALLDVALEEFLRVKVEAVDPAALPPPDRIALLQLLLDSASLDAVAGEEDDVVQCAALWRAVAGIAAAGDASWTCDAAQAVLAASQRTELALAARADRTDEASLPHQAAALALRLLDLAAADDGSARRPPSPPSASSVAESYALAFATDLDAAADAGDGGLLGRAAAVLAAGGGGDWGAAAAPSPAAMVDGV